VYVVQLIVNDGTADSAPDTVKVTARVNHAPAITSTAPTAATVGSPYTYPVAASDPDPGDTLTFALDTAPAGMAIDPGSGRITWTPAAAGAFAVVVRVTDAGGLSATQAFTIQVARPNTPPKLQPIGDRTIDLGQGLHMRVFAVDPDPGEVLRYSLAVAPAGMQIDPATGAIQWTPTAPGRFAAAVQVADHAGATDLAGFHVTVARILPPAGGGAANRPPQVAAIADRTLVVGETLRLAVQASDPDGDPLTYGLANGPAGMAVAADGTLQWTAAGPGPHDVAVEVSDPAGLTATTSFTVTVTEPNRPPVATDDLYTARTGQTLTVAAPGVLANDTDPDGDPLTATVVRGPTNGVLNFNPDGSFDYTPLSPHSGPEVVEVRLFRNLVTRYPAVKVAASSEEPADPGYHVVDGDAATVWSTTPAGTLGSGATPYCELTFPREVTVTEVHLAGTPGAAESFTAGVVTLYDTAGNLLYDSGEVTLPEPDRALVVRVPETSGVRRVRFTGTAVQNPAATTNTLAEFAPYGWVKAFRKRKSNVDLTRHAPVETWASSTQDSAHAPDYALDASLTTGWQPHDWTTHPLLDVTFPEQTVTVREVRLSSLRYKDGSPDGRNAFTSGLVHLYDEAGGELWSGPATFAPPEYDARVAVPAVAGVRKVRFEGTGWNGPLPVLAEIQVIGDGLIRPLYPGVEWAWTGTAQPVFGNLPATSVYMSPLVADLDGDGYPEVVVAAHSPQVPGESGPAVLVVLDGRTGQEKQVVTDPQVEMATSMALGDIDGDGLPEIVALDASRRHLVAFENDLSVKWQSDPITPPYWDGITIADLDADGSPEILVNNQVLDAAGHLQWRATAVGTATIPAVADIDLDGRQEVLFGNVAYRADGTYLWHGSGGWGRWAAVGNFNDDPYPEIVVSGRGWGAMNLELLDHEGNLIWYTNKAGGGPPTVADFDGDGEPEVGLAGRSYYYVVDTDGRLIWKQPIIDGSSAQTGSSVFDFDGDGVAEVVQRDEEYLRIFRGEDGKVLYRIPNTSLTNNELPLVADVDGDGHAEVVTGANLSFRQNQNTPGVYVIGGLDGDWVRTRKIWNQHAYHVTNVNTDATIPAHERPSWLVPGL
ncbi:MAG: hypothetical protein D6739_00520, partial [Nitrospirae bacterium]